MKIPADWDDVTVGWLNARLEHVVPGGRITDAECSWRSDGSNRRAKFALTWDGAPGPDVVFLKAEGAHRETHARNGNLFNEPKLLASGIELPLDHPDVYSVIIDEPALDWLVVMEDVSLRGADPRDATRPMTPDQAAAGCRALGRLHSRYAGFDDDRLGWVQTWAPTEGFAYGLRLRTPTGIERAGNDLPAEVAKLSGDEVVDIWARYVALLHRQPTLLHADAHVGNTYVLPGDDVGFLDWAVCRRGHWSQDIGHFLQGAITIEDRRSYDRAILADYARSTGIDLEEAFTWYRASAAYGLAIWLSTLGTDGYQSREISLALATRFADAFVDLDCLDAIESLE